MLAQKVAIAPGNESHCLIITINVWVQTLLLFFVTVFNKMYIFIYIYLFIWAEWGGRGPKRTNPEHCRREPPSFSPLRSHCYWLTTSWCLRQSVCDPFRCWPDQSVHLVFHHLLRVNSAGYWLDVLPVCSSVNQPPVWMWRKEKPESEQSFHLMGWTQKCPDSSALQRTSNSHIANCLLSIFSFSLPRTVLGELVGLDRACRGWQTFVRFLRLWLFWPCGVVVTTSEVEAASVTRVFSKQNTCLS